ncbi:glycosyltransferase family 4 protein [Dietzia maris]
MNSTDKASRTILYGTTIGSSTWSFLRGQLSYFQQNGAEVHAVSSPDRLLVQAGAREGISTHGIPMEREISPLADIVALSKWIRLMLAIRPEVVNVGTPKAALLGLIAAWLTRVPVRVYTVRGLRYETTKGRKRTLLILAEKLCCALSSHTVAVGHGVAQRMREDVSPRGQIIVIGDGSSNGVRGDEIATKSESLDASICRSHWSIPTEATVIGFVGRITLDKGGDCLVGALSLLERKRPDLALQLLVVGDIEDRTAATSLAGVSVPTISTGWLDDPIGAFRAMDMLCLPTRREGFPNVVLEAGAAALPVITTHATGAWESVIPGETGLLVPIDDEAALARAIEHLAESRQTRNTMGQNARARMLTRFKPERIWQTLDEIYSGSSPSDVTYY